MSLIPSESYSFPDHFTRTVVPSRKPKNEEPEPVPLETTRKKSAIVPLPDPEVRPPTAPRLIPPPQASGVKTAAPAQMQSVPAKPRPVAVSNPQADFFATLARTREIAMLAQTREIALSNQRQKMKFRRFIVCECAALGTLLPVGIGVLTMHPPSAATRWIINISAVASAVTAALIPII